MSEADIFSTHETLRPAFSNETRHKRITKHGCQIWKREVSRSFPQIKCTERKATFLIRYKIYFSSHHKEYTELGIIGPHFISTELCVAREIGMNFLMVSILYVELVRKQNVHRRVNTSIRAGRGRRGYSFIVARLEKAQDFIFRAKIRDDKTL
jgi:hypothetical protein